MSAHQTARPGSRFRRTSGEMSKFAVQEPDVVVVACRVASNLRPAAQLVMTAVA